jgi:hypothetical protein
MRRILTIKIEEDMCPNYDPRDLVNHTTLNWTNPFGNNNRFTAIDGTQIYTAGVAIDWTSYNIPAETVVCFDINMYNDTYANAVTYASGLTLAGLSTWKVGIWDELALLPDQTNWFNFAPFNWVVGASTSTRLRINGFNDGTNAIEARTIGNFLGANLTTARLHPITRVTTLSELGL